MTSSPQTLTAEPTQSGPAAAAESSRQRVTDYLLRILKVNLIQPFGFLIALDDKTFRVVAYSDNASRMLEAQPPITLGSDIRTSFTAAGAAALERSFRTTKVSILNPVVVHSAASGSPFYAILHRVTAALIIDFEPVRAHEVPTMEAGAQMSVRLAAKGMARLQAQPTGSMEGLCEALGQGVFELSGYQKVMVYRFLEGGHGEIVTEVTNPGLDLHLGLRCPAIDIPQGARFLFKLNKARMICDCGADLVKVVRDESQPKELNLCGSTLRAPFDSRLEWMENTRSKASLVISVVLNEEKTEETSQQLPAKKNKMWGLVICRHDSPRFVSFPVRYACKFLTQVFATIVDKDLELENQTVENANAAVL